MFFNCFMANQIQTFPIIQWEEPRTTYAVQATPVVADSPAKTPIWPGVIGVTFWAMLLIGLPVYHNYQQTVQPVPYSQSK